MNGYNHMNGNGNGNGSGPSHNTNTFENVQIPTGPTNQPRVLIRQLDDMEAVFNLSGVETGYANSLRRVIMADVPTICMSPLLLPWFPASSCLSIFIRSSPSGHSYWLGSWKWIWGRDTRTGCIGCELWKDKLRADTRLIPGIDQVLFTQNTSPIPDEMLAHRLGMVPLVSQKVMDGLRYTRVSTSSFLPLDSVSLGSCPYLDKTD